MSEIELVRMHVEALFTHDARGRMRSVNEPGGGRAPRFYFGRTSVGHVWRFRDDLGAGLVEMLESLCAREPRSKSVTTEAWDHEAYVRALDQYTPVEHLWEGPAYRFPAEWPADPEAREVTPENAEVLRPYFEDWLLDVQDSQPFLAVLSGGVAVSICCSVRTTGLAHEAGVETHEDFRGQGHAGRVVGAWARKVRQHGRVPLYSTSWENRASQAVARKLGLVQYGSDLHIT